MEGKPISKRRDSWLKIIILIVIGAVAGYMVSIGFTVTKHNSSFSGKNMDEKRAPPT